MYPFNADKAKALLDGAGWVPDKDDRLRGQGRQDTDASGSSRTGDGMTG